MLRLLLSVPAVLFAFVWSLFVPKKHRTPLPPAPDPDAPSTESREDGHEDHTRVDSRGARGAARARRADPGLPGTRPGETASDGIGIHDRCH